MDRCVIERITGEHRTIAAPNCDGGGGSRDVAATEIGTREGESSSSGGRTRGQTEDLVDLGRGVGEEHGVACLSVRLWNVVCVFLCVFVCAVACVLEKRQEERRRRGREENKSVCKCIDFSKNKNKGEDRRKSTEARYHMGIATEKQTPSKGLINNKNRIKQKILVY